MIHNCSTCLRMNHQSNFCSVFKTVIENIEETYCPAHCGEVIPCPNCGSTVAPNSLVWSIDDDKWTCFYCYKMVGNSEQSNTDQN
jgi:hypothetical protein